MSQHGQEIRSVSGRPAGLRQRKQGANARKGEIERERKSCQPSQTSRSRVMRKGEGSAHLIERKQQFLLQVWTQCGDLGVQALQPVHQQPAAETRFSHLGPAGGEERERSDAAATVKRLATRVQRKRSGFKKGKTERPQRNKSGMIFILLLPSEGTQTCWFADKHCV